ncbi:hypothetical protein B7463_g9026, partial [Scytalidium lignicola]
MQVSVYAVTHPPGGDKPEQAHPASPKKPKGTHADGFCEIQPGVETAQLAYAKSPTPQLQPTWAIRMVLRAHLLQIPGWKVSGVIGPRDEVQF